MTVELRSESGKWSKKVAVDDPVFLPILPVECGDLPDIFILPGVVGEIFEREWAHYEIMAHYRENNAIEIIYLHQVKDIVRILDPPSGWEKNVAVDLNTPTEERLHHYRMQGAAIRAEYEKEMKLLDTRLRLCYPRVCDMELGELPMSHLLSHFQRNDPSDELLGVRRNTTLTYIAKNMPTCYAEWAHVIWEDVVALGMLNDRTTSDRVRDTIRLLTGGEAEDTLSLSRPRRSALRYPEPGIMVIEHQHELCALLTRSLSEKDLLAAMEPIVRYYYYHDTYPSMMDDSVSEDITYSTLLPWLIKSSVVLAAHCETASPLRPDLDTVIPPKYVSEKVFPRSCRELVASIGVEASRIVRNILMASKEEANRRVRLFVSSLGAEIERYENRLG